MPNLAEQQPLILTELTSHRHILLLQGPIGWFFKYLADYLSTKGCNVFKVNFNGGDDFFYQKRPTHRYREVPSQWQGWFRNFIRQQNISAIVLFGQWREYHKTAIDITGQLGIMVYVFEEGYIRPNYVTLERQGVNGNSLIPKDPQYYRNRPQRPNPESRNVGSRFFKVAGIAMLYYLAASALSLRYPHYKHHRPMNPLTEGGAWLRSLARKPYYHLRERPILQYLKSLQMHKRYFIVPLQVHNDSQIKHHSDFESVEEFIQEVTASFSHFCPEWYSLVFKHHPMDRGYKDYKNLINSLTEQYHLGRRCLYIHDGHLPTLLQNAKGTVTVNSTVGLSSLHHETPVKVMGEAVYAIPGMVDTCKLDEFWTNAKPVDHDLVMRFTRELITMTQLNAGFYTRSSFPNIFKIHTPNDS